MEQSIGDAYSSSCTQMMNKGTLRDESIKTKNVFQLPELFTDGSLLELCNSLWKSSPDRRMDVQPYLRGCKWSPDGTCCLSVVNHDGFHVMELPRDLYEGRPNCDRMITLLSPVIHIKESGLIYDFCWYPGMNSHYPETCNWISTKVNSPIQMWDAYDGSLRCSYRGFNAVDEMEPAISVTFINNGKTIVGGYKNCLRTFDIERPGREFIQHKTKSAASCFATHGNLLAVGSWNASIKLFSILDNWTYRSVGNLHGHRGGITHLQFTPDGTKLVSGARKDHNLFVWDVRYHKRPLNILKRSVSTNQRIYFDISNCGRYLVSGGTDGVIRVWDDKFTKWTEQFCVDRGNQENATFRFQLYRDCCNSVSIHPTRPILATGSGQFHFLDPVKVLEREPDNHTNCEDDVTLVSVSDRTSCDKQHISQDVENIIEVDTTDIASDVNLQTQAISENSSNDVNLRDFVEMCTDRTSDQDVAEMTSPKMITEHTSAKSSTSKPEFSKEMNSTSKVENIIKTCNVNPNIENIYEEPPTKKIKLTTSDQVAMEVCDTREALIEEQCNDRELIIKENIDVQSYKEVTKVDEENDANVSSIVESPRNREQEIISGSNILLEGIKVGTDNHTTAELRTLNGTDKSSSKNHNERNIEEVSDEKSIVDKTLESDDDYDDINENKMKYSSYAENNLTFWWISKIFEKPLVK